MFFLICDVFWIFISYYLSITWILSLSSSSSYLILVCIESHVIYLKGLSYCLCWTEAISSSWICSGSNIAKAKSFWTFKSELSSSKMVFLRSNSSLRASSLSISYSYFNNNCYALSYFMTIFSFSSIILPYIEWGFRSLFLFIIYSF